MTPYTLTEPIRHKIAQLLAETRYSYEEEQGLRWYAEASIAATYRAGLPEAIRTASEAHPEYFPTLVEARFHAYEGARYGNRAWLDLSDYRLPATVDAHGHAVRIAWLEPNGETDRLLEHIQLKLALYSQTKILLQRYRTTETLLKAVPNLEPIVGQVIEDGGIRRRSGINRQADAKRAQLINNLLEEHQPEENTNDT